MERTYVLYDDDGVTNDYKKGLCRKRPPSIMSVHRCGEVDFSSEASTPTS